MFKYKSLVIVLLGLVACGSPNKKTPQEEDNCGVEDHCTQVLVKTDSILVLADEEFESMKQHKVEQKVFVDSLKHTIEIEQYTINDLNKEVNRRINVDSELQTTKGELEKALITCKNKEKELKELNEKFGLESKQLMDKIEYYIDREVKLVTIYNHKIDSLIFIIDSLPRVRRFRNR